MPALLVVTDAVWVANDVRAAISDPSTTVQIAEDADRAVELVTESWFDAIIVDMQVGSAGGMAITRRLRDAMASEEVERAPIVLLLDRQADAFLAKRAGASAHILKPFTSQDLRGVLGTLAASKP
jgi:CheY-like chemotaxis protein